TLQPLIALYPTIGRIAGFTFLVGDLDPVDATVACIEQSEIIGPSVGEGDTVGRIGTGSVHQARNELFVLGDRGRADNEGRAQQGDEGEQEEGPYCPFHDVSRVP